MIYVHLKVINVFLITNMSVITFRTGASLRAHGVLGK